MKKINRRDFVHASVSGMGLAIVSSGLTGCFLDDDDLIPVSFDYGVASGDPLSDRVIIWTHVNAEDNREVIVSWKVIDDTTGLEVVTGFTAVNTSTGHTLKVDVTGLLPERRYRYQFSSNATLSEMGYTKTLPQGSGTQQARFAVISCSNYPAGYFHVYREISQLEELDAVLHLGDYIYEYGDDGYATERAAELGRTFPDNNSHEILTLNDYRHRYALYRSDTDLQNCHAAHPFITVWDDHEVTNDAWKNGAENHNAGEGNYQERKLNALQAYFEWMPIRVNPIGDSYRSYRQFQFGDLVDLMMLDTRLEGRDQQINIADYLDGSVLDAVGFSAALSDMSRTMLGLQQFQWLQNALTNSTAKWQVLGQQVLMGRMLLPAAIATQALSIPEFTVIATAAGIAARVQAGDPTLTENELEYLTANQGLLTQENMALIQLPAIPYNLDAWDGYGYERELLLGIAQNTNANLIVLAGDTHNAWASNLKTLDGNAAGVEFATSSVSSPGLEEYLQIPDRDTAVTTEAGIVQLVTDLHYTNVYDRGYMTVEFTPGKVVSQWKFVDTVHSQDYVTLDSRANTIEVLNNAGGIQIS